MSEFSQYGPVCNGRESGYKFDPNGALPTLQWLRSRLNRVRTMAVFGRVIRATGLLIEAICPPSFVGELCYIQSGNGECRPLIDSDSIPCEVVGFKDGVTLLMPLAETAGLWSGAKVLLTGKELTVNVSWGLVGRVLDGLGRPMDGKPLPRGEERPLYSPPPMPLERPIIDEPLPVGVRSIDGFVTIGKGQRVGIFAGSGVGKSTLLGMMGRYAKADVIVMALIGERGREVREFIERELTDEGLKRSVLVVATSDQPPIVRFKGAFVAMTIAEFFRDCGADVLLLMDSLTRWAMAGREVGLSIGEPPTSRGYTPSVFALMPKLLERAGRSSYGSITALITVLVEGDDFGEPISDHARSILDGHIILSRELANRGWMPPVDILGSVSRVMPDIVSKEHLEAAIELRGLMASYRDCEDLIRLGAYQPGRDAVLDRAVSIQGELAAFCMQGRFEHTPFETTVEKLLKLKQLSRAVPEAA